MQIIIINVEEIKWEIFWIFGIKKKGEEEPMRDLIFRI
jgi:hypothetical protein